MHLPQKRGHILIFSTHNEFPCPLCLSLSAAPKPLIRGHAGLPRLLPPSTPASRPLPHKLTAPLRHNHKGRAFPRPFWLEQQGYHPRCKLKTVRS